MSLKNRVLFITGGSRGIGRAIALKAAARGAKIIIGAKTVKAHASLAGTIHSVAAEIEAAGGQALPIELDVRDDAALKRAADQAAQHFGGIDVVINNASAIKLAPTEDTPAKAFDLMQNVNARGSFLTVQACLPYLKKSENAHIITLSPPINLNPQWLGASPAYMLSKYGMSLLTLGFAEEFKADNIKANTLWPETLIATDAIKVNFPQLYKYSMSPEIVADAVHDLLKMDNPPNGQSLTDQQVLKMNGLFDFKSYYTDPETTPKRDMFLDD